MNAVLARWNHLPPAEAAREVLPCCGSELWAERLASMRPFPNEDAVYNTSDAIWLGLPEAAWQQAFDSHPRIGQRHAQQATEESLRWSAQEQQAADHSDAAAKLALEAANRGYEAHFGRIFIVCASGKSSTEILSILEARMTNDPVTELHEAAEQQRQITQPPPAPLVGGQLSMGISTHILDTALGQPAAQVAVTLEREESGHWHTLQTTATDSDGRCKQLLPDGVPLQTATYRIRFDTAAYYAAQHLAGLYPFVEITFTVTNPGQHFHIPLLLTANGYTTYRGS